MSHRRHSFAALTLVLLGLCASGCAMFQSPDPNDIPKSRYDNDDEPIDPEKQKPLVDADTFKQDNIRRQFKKLMGQGPDRAKARDIYAQGAAKYEESQSLEGAARQQKLIEAAELFVDAADRWPNTSLEQDALFMAGDSYFFADYYVDANRQYELLVKKYPNSRHLDVVEARRFLIAKYWLKANQESPEYALVNFTDEERPWFDTRGNALRVYDKIRLDDPTGKLADDATLAAATERFVNREWEKADEYYSDLIAAYPDSEHQYNAHFYGLKAKLNKYRGADYEGSALEEGEKLIKQMRRQFPQQAAQEREFLDRSFAEIRYKKAERIWKMSDYYYNRGEYGGSKFYLNDLVREYDDTPFADKARQRLAEIADKPDVPPQKLKWLVDLFPEADPLKPILEKAETKLEQKADVDVTVNQ